MENQPVYLLEPLATRTPVVAGPGHYHVIRGTLFTALKSERGQRLPVDPAALEAHAGILREGDTVQLDGRDTLTVVRDGTQLILRCPDGSGLAISPAIARRVAKVFGADVVRESFGEAFTNFRGIELAGAMPYADFRAELGQQRYVDFFRPEAEAAYNRKAEQMEKAYRRNRPLSPELKTGEELWRYVETAMKNSCRGSADTPYIPEGGNGYYTNYGKGIGKGALMCVYVNPRQETLAEILQAIDASLRGCNAQLKVYVEALTSHTSADKVVIYFDTADTESKERFFHAFAPLMPALAPNVEAEPLGVQLMNMRVPLHPGISMVERPWQQSWDTNYKALLKQGWEMKKAIRGNKNLSADEWASLFELSDLGKRYGRHPGMPALQFTSPDARSETAYVQARAS